MWRRLPQGAKASPSVRPWSWRVFLTCWLFYCVFWTPYIVREHFPALALTEQGSLNVERYAGWTEDIFRGPGGGAYINNNPGASITGAIPLILLRPLLRRVDEWNQTLPRTRRQPEDGEVFWLTLEQGRGFYFLLVAFITVAMVMAPLTAATASFLCSRLIEFGVAPAGASLCAMLYGIGTPVLFRVGHLNHNLLAGDAGFLAFLLLWKPRDWPVTTARAFAAGLLAGYAIFCDYSGIVVIAVTALYTCLRSAGATRKTRFRTLASYAAGVAPALIALALYQAWAFGSPYKPSQHYMVPTAPTSHGYRGFDWPSASLLWANFFDPRFGLFSWCPALALAFLAPFQQRARYKIPRREMWVLFLYFGLFVVFCAANQYSWLQPSTGFRYLVPVVPALALLALQAAQSLPLIARWIVAIGACAQSLVMTAAHENDVRLSVPALWYRRFELVWMNRLARAGAPFSWWWVPVVFAGLAVATILIWRGKLASTCQTSQS